MRYARFIDTAGSVRTGEWTGDGIVEGPHTHDPSAVRLLPPVSPSKVLGVAYNYAPESEPVDTSGEPIVWVKGGPNVLAGPGDTVRLPAGCSVIHEAEVGVVIGEQCRNVPVEEALEVVRGFTCVNDLSNQTVDEDDPTFLRVKSFDNSAPMGPVLATPEEVAVNPRIRLWVNGDKRQDSAGETMVYGVAEVVAVLSSWMTLEAEDVILMGTPSGASPLADGDQVRIEIDGIGVLEHGVRTVGS